MSRSDKTPSPVEVRALEPYRIWIRYDDGVEGELDLSDMAGDGVFVAWEDHSVFAGVHLGSGDSIAWSEEIDMCGDALHLEITGMTPEQLFPRLRETANA